MLKFLIHAFVDFVRDEDGQSITEYAAVIAFVGVLIAVCFAIARGGLFAAVSDSFSSIGSALNATNQAASTT
jgi:Flp pilus assembly pilin Flp